MSLLQCTMFSISFIVLIKINIKEEVMLNKNIILTLIALFVIFFSLTAVSATQNNITDDLTTYTDSNIEYSSYEITKNNDNSLKSNDGEYVDVSEAYSYLNEFRTENGVWQWNSDDISKTYFNTNGTNTLNPLSRDVNLEKTAQIRAKELAQSFSHTRPDGTSCFTAFPNGLFAMGENIAMGQQSCKDVTESWKETNDLYNGQGHRRNMLSENFNCVGIAGYKLNGVIYWVQDFGKSTNINEGENSPTNNPIEDNTEKTDSKSSAIKIKKVKPKLTAKNTSFKSKLKTKKYSILLKYKNTGIKKVKVYLKVNGKTYKATTNSKGKATFKITKLTKKSTFNAKITFKGTKYYTAVSKTIKLNIR